MHPRFLAAALLLSFVPSLRAQTAPPPTHIVPVVLKLDDVRTNASGWLSERWRRIGDLTRDRGIKVSLGVIADSLEGENPSYFSWLREMHASGLVELWFHGYDHDTWQDETNTTRSEFFGRPFEDQLDRFVRSQQLAREKIGIPFATFGPTGGGTGSHQDAATAQAMTREPDMKVWLYPSPIDDMGRQLVADGKVTILDRVWQVNIEQPLFLPNYEAFVTNYNQFAASRRYFVLQGHAGKWDDARWAEFVKIVDYLTQNNIPIVTPSELAATLNPPATFVSGLPFSTVADDGASVRRDQHQNGGTIVLNNITFAKGLGVHAPTEILIPLDGLHTRFLSDVGIDDSVGGTGSVVFQVWADGVKLYDSGSMTGASATRTVDVDVKGRTALRLIVTDGGDGKGSDRADWANARLVGTSRFAWNILKFEDDAHDPAIAGTLADPDADGLVNVLEYALGAEPLTAAPAPSVVVLDQRLQLTFIRIADPDLRYTVEASNTLGDAADWQSIWSSTGADNTAGSVTVNDPATLDEHPRRFLRLNVTGY